MADTRKKYQVGKPLGNYKPGQAGYMVGPDSTLEGITVHVTIDGMATIGKWDRVVRSFHLSFKNLSPQPVAKWSYNSALDQYTFTGWANFDQLGIAQVDRPAFVTKVNNKIRGLKAQFGSSGFGLAT